MNILIVSQSFYPDVFMINDTVRILSERGHKVTVLTGLPDYTTNTIPDEYKHNQKSYERYHDVDVYRVNTIARRTGPIFRSLNYLSFVFNGNRFIRTHDLSDIDIVYVWEVSPVTMGIPAITFKKKYNKPLLLYCMDIWPECVKAMGFKENTLPYNIIHRISKYVYRNCDHIMVSSKPFINYLNEVNDIDIDKMSYLPQYASDELLDRNFNKKKDDHTDFIFVGNIGKAQNMHCLIKAINKIKDRKDIKFHIIGGGSELENTKRLVKDLGIENLIEFYGPKTFNESLDYYKKADACILTLDGSNKIGDTLPGKLQTYMAIGKPIIASINGAGQEIIKESKCGLVVDAGDDEGLANLFIEYIENKDKYKKCGSNARKYFKENFTQEKHFKELENQLSLLTGVSV